MAKGKGGFIGQDGLNAPDSPTEVSGTAADTEVNVSFTAPSDVGGSAITGYRVTDSTGAHGASGSSSPITVTGLTNGTSYTFNVWAINAFGYSAPSDATSGITPAVQNFAFFLRGGGNTDISKLNFASTGNDEDFGDTAVSINVPCALSNATRLVVGRRESNTTRMDYFATSSGGTGADFGDQTTVGYGGAAVNNNTRGVFMGGYDSGVINIMDYITISTLGDAIDFGDLTVGKYRGAGSINSTTRGIHAAGYLQGFSMTNVIDYITIASTGNATDFGDTSAAKRQQGGCSNSTRGLISGGYVSGSINEIEYVTIASTGNATDFGDLSAAANEVGCGANSTSGVIASSNFSSGSRIQYVTIASTGNSSTWGDLTIFTGAQYGTSSAHGGLS